MNYLYNDNLETDRLITRFLTKDDISIWAKFLGDKESIQFFPNTSFKSPEEHSEFWIEKQLLRYKENRYGLQALINKDTGEFIGQCGLLLQEIDGIPELEVGYHIFKNHRGKGYATEAAKTFKAYGLKHKQADSIISIIHTENLNSQNVAIKNGMQLEKKSKWMDLDVLIFR